MNKNKAINYFLVCLSSLIFTTFACNASPPSEGKHKEQDEKTVLYKLLPQQFVIYIDNEEFDYINIYVEQNLTYYKDMPKTEFSKYIAEWKDVGYFASQLEGKIYIYHQGSPAEPEYEISLPSNKSQQTTIHTKGKEWVGISIPGIKIKGKGNFVIKSELYSKSNQYNSYMIGFEKNYGTK
ncbi:TPA: hypothetical protein R0C45_005009 [Kluyvera ascorbata F0526]|nr:hypothetical protein [Kluyvera ascorbata F0526]